MTERILRVASRQPPTHPAVSSSALLLLLLHFISHAVALPEECAGKFFVPSLPGLAAEDALAIDQYAGHIAMDADRTKNLFFWLITADKTIPKASSQHLIIWLNGGPGCSSMDGMFLENGPYELSKVEGGVKLSPREGSWHRLADVVYVDQPVGTGLSYIKDGADKLARSEAQIVSDFMSFLDKFLDIFPIYRRHNIYLGGESFAGIYIPYIAREILSQNTAASTKKYNLKGIMIGNGWIDPLRQYKAAYDFSKLHNLYKGIPKYEKLGADTWAQCQAKYVTIKTNNGPEPINENTCERLNDIATDASKSDGGECLNMYDIRKTDATCGYGWPPGLAEMKSILTDPVFLKAIHAELPPNDTKKVWSECSGDVGSALNNDKSPASYLYLPEILDKIHVLLFSGDKDFICNHLGTEYMIDALSWGQGKKYGSASLPGWSTSKSANSWVLDKNAVGEWTYDRNLSYVKVFSASHMVPFDQPLAALEMVRKFLALSLTQTLPSAGLLPLPISQPSRPVSTPGGSVTTVLVVLGLLVGVVAVGSAFWYKSRKTYPFQSRLSIQTQWHPLASTADP